MFGEEIIGGTLQMVHSAAECILLPEQTWITHPVNRIAMLSFTLLALFGLRNFLRLIPYLADCIIRYRANIGMEHSLQLAHDRNSAASILAIAFCLITDRYQLFPASFVTSQSYGWSLATIAACAAVYILIRFATRLMKRPDRMDSETFKACNNAYRTYFVIMTTVMVISLMVLSIFSAMDATVRVVMYIEIAVFFLLACMRNAQILKSQCSGAKTFLYLCTLEILPAGMLVATALLA